MTRSVKEEESHPGHSCGEVCETFRWRCWRSCGSVGVQLEREGMLRKFQEELSQRVFIEHLLCARRFA